MSVFSICVFYSATVPLLTVACALYAFLRHYVDALNLITVYKKEIDSQGKLISTVTNSALVVVFSYQLCMAAFLTVKERDYEALTCIIIFVFSVIYTVAAYEKVNDNGEFEN